MFKGLASRVAPPAWGGLDGQVIEDDDDVEEDNNCKHDDDDVHDVQTAVVLTSDSNGVVFTTDASRSPPPPTAVETTSESAAGTGSNEFSATATATGTTTTTTTTGNTTGSATGAAGGSKGSASSSATATGAPPKTDVVVAAAATAAGAAGAAATAAAAAAVIGRGFGVGIYDYLARSLDRIVISAWADFESCDHHEDFVSNRLHIDGRYDSMLGHIHSQQGLTALALYERIGLLQSLTFEKCYDSELMIRIISSHVCVNGMGVTVTRSSERTRWLPRNLSRAGVWKRRRRRGDAEEP